MTPLTFADALARRLRSAAGSPLVVHYDHSAGTRVELSGTTYANWVAKTSSLAIDAVGLDRGERVHLDLPPHWIEVVWVGACLNVGLVLTGSPESADLIVTGPDGVDRSNGGAPVIATSLHPFALRFTEPLPSGVLDFGAEVFGQPDAFMPYDPPTADDPAVDLGDGERSMTELFEQAASLEPGRRTITDVPCRLRPELLLAPLLGDGMTVWSSGGGAEQWADVMRAERVTAELREDSGEISR